jgi:hypothetical protein
MGHNAGVFVRRFGWIFCLLLLVQCKNKHAATLYAKPKALGKPLELGIVAHDSVWKGRQGVFLREFTARGDTFSCLHISPEDTAHFAGLHRNLLYIGSPTPPRKLLDQRAFGQTSQYYTRLDSTRLREALAYVWEQEKERMRTYTFAFVEGQSTALERWVGKHYPFRLRILPEFQLVKGAQDVLLLKTDRGAEKYIFIAKQPQKIPFSPAQYWIKQAKKGRYHLVFAIKKGRTAPALAYLEMEALMDTFRVSE